MFSQRANANTSRPPEHIPAFCISALQGERHGRKKTPVNQDPPLVEGVWPRGATLNLARLPKGQMWAEPERITREDVPVANPRRTAADDQRKSASIESPAVRQLLSGPQGPRASPAGQQRASGGGGARSDSNRSATQIPFLPMNGEEAACRRKRFHFLFSF